MISELFINKLKANQAPSGAFLSKVHLVEGPISDENGFVTALILRELALFSDPALTEIKEKALDFLESCEDPKLKGAFLFYPHDKHPQWMCLTQPLPADADDTSLYNLELYKAGRKSLKDLQNVVKTTLIPSMLHIIPVRCLFWVRPGTFKTWLDANYYPNIVDICVNVNVLSILKTAQLSTITGYKETIEMVKLGIEWAIHHKERVHLLMPYYPDPMELKYALEHCLLSGVKELEPLYNTTCGHNWSNYDKLEKWPVNRPICSSADNQIVWTCSTLQWLRQEVHILKKHTNN